MRELLEQSDSFPVVTVAAGEQLIAEGADSGRLYILIEGKVEIRKGELRIATFTEPGTPLGEISALTGGPHSASVVALEPSTLRLVPNPASTLQSSPALTLALARLLASRLALVTAYLADIQRQYGGSGTSLGLLDEVLTSLLNHSAPAARPGSAREPEPLA